MLLFYLTRMPVKQRNELDDLQKSFHLRSLGKLFPKIYCVGGREVSGFRECTGPTS